MTPMRIITVALLLFALAGAGAWWARAHATSCSNLPDIKKRECWQRELVSVLKNDGIDAAFNTLAALYKSDPTFSVYCHDYAHLIGNTAYEEFSKTGKTQLSPLASYCGFGFYHGFMESLLYTTGNLQEARDFCAYAQKELGGDAKGACYHGIGHGFLDGTDREGWGDAAAMVKAGLSLCERVGESSYYVNRCASGVFNSLAILSDNPQEKDSIDMDRSDPYWLCRLQTKEYIRTPCYEEMNTLVYRINKGDMAKAAAQVSRIPGDADASNAMEALASYSARFSIQSFDGSRWAQFCEGLEPRLRLPCAKGMATGLAEFGAPGQEYVKSLAFCQYEGLPEADRAGCMARLMPYLGVMYSAAQLKNICASAVEPAYRKTYCPA